MVHFDPLFLFILLVIRASSFPIKVEENALCNISATVADIPKRNSEGSTKLGKRSFLGFGKKKSSKARHYEKLPEASSSHDSGPSSSREIHENGFDQLYEREGESGRQDRKRNASRLELVCEDVEALMAVPGFKQSFSSPVEEVTQVMSMVEAISYGTEVKLPLKGLNDPQAEALRRHYFCQVRMVQEIIQEEIKTSRKNQLRLGGSTVEEQKILKEAALEASKALNGLRLRYNELVAETMSSKGW